MHLIFRDKSEYLDPVNLLFIGRVSKTVMMILIEILYSLLCYLVIMREKEKKEKSWD